MFFMFLLYSCSILDIAQLPALCLSIIDDLIPVDLLRPQTTGRSVGWSVGRSVNRIESVELGQRAGRTPLCSSCSRHFVCTRRVDAAAAAAFMAEGRCFHVCVSVPSCGEGQRCTCLINKPS